MQKAILAIVLASLSLPAAAQDTGFKNFNLFKDVLPGVDFFAANRQQATPFEKPLTESRQKLVDLLGSAIPKGAIFICSTLEQKDAVYEPRAIKMGYGWVLMALTAEARADETLARLKAQTGGQVPPQVLERLQNRSPEMQAAAEAGMVRSAARQMAYAVLQTALTETKDFRLTRLEDMARSPLPDWLDIGIATYAAGGATNVDMLQQRLDEAFPLEDIFSMSRPYVAPSAEGGSGGGFMIRMEGSPGGMPPAGAGGGTRGGGGRQMPKDVQDRMLFDAQSSTFFEFLRQKTGPDRTRELIGHCRAGKDTRAFVTRDDVLGSDFAKIEQEWTEWVRALKSERPMEMRIQRSPDRPGPPPW
ncbi:MAG: hypothetical protein FJW35_18765 [Acidobacteria bacterium]|nr:hypothetical protein [Acidobacteriota bacterium]